MPSHGLHNWSPHNQCSHGKRVWLQIGKELLEIHPDPEAVPNPCGPTSDNHLLKDHQNEKVVRAQPGPHISSQLFSWSCPGIKIEIGAESSYPGFPNTHLRSDTFFESLSFLPVNWIFNVFSFSRKQPQSPFLCLFHSQKEDLTHLKVTCLCFPKPKAVYIEDTIKEFHEILSISYISFIVFCTLKYFSPHRYLGLSTSS